MSADARLAAALREHFERETLRAAVEDVERHFARSQSDALAHRTALMIHNAYRAKAGLPRLVPSDLPAYLGDGEYEIRDLPLTPKEATP